MYSMPAAQQAVLANSIAASGAHPLIGGGYDVAAWHVIVPILKNVQAERDLFLIHGRTVSFDMFELPTRKAARRLVQTLRFDGIHAYLSTAGHKHN